MNTLLEVLVAIFLHPIAVILAWLNLANRTDLSTGAKILWGLVSLIWGLGPILYIFLGNGALW